MNVIWDLAPHDLSIVDHILGHQPRSISAWGCAHADPDIEDIAYVNVDYGDRLMANFHVNWLSPVKVRQMIFAGSRKSLIFNELNTTEPLKVYDRGIELAETAAEAAQRLLSRLPHRRHVEPAHRAGGSAAGGGQPLRRVHPRAGGSAQRRAAGRAGGPPAGGGHPEHPGPGRPGGPVRERERLMSRGAMVMRLTSDPTRRTSSASSPTCSSGGDVAIHCFVNLYGCTIGDETRVGAFVEIQKNAMIGARCKISSHTFICEGVTIEDEVFVGHGVMFINDLDPRATNEDGELADRRPTGS